MSNEKEDPEGPPLVVWCPLYQDMTGTDDCPHCEFREECKNG